MPRTALWGRGFRPFFLVGAIYAFGVLPFWLAIFAGWITAPVWLSGADWHGHEMLFGVVIAAVSGFLLTAVPNWTGRAPVCGRRLAALVGLWLAGRAAMLAAGVLPAWVVAVADLAFLPVLIWVLARPILGSGRRRNYGFIPLLAALWVADLLVHLQALHLAQTALMGLRLAVDLLIVLIIVISGRITPLFTKSALARANHPPSVLVRPWLDRLAITLAVLFAASDLAPPWTLWTGLLALATALALVARMAGWGTLRTLRDPLLWSLHLASLWIAAGLALVALADLTSLIGWPTALHALTAGAMGAAIMAVMTRVSLGHTGRPFVAPAGAVLAYVLVNVGALIRVLAPIVLPAGDHLIAFGVGGALWSLAFGVFAVSYWPILTGPRIDGKPG